MPDKKCVEKVRANRANFYFATVFLTIVVLIVLLNS